MCIDCNVRNIEVLLPSGKFTKLSNTEVIKCNDRNRVIKLDYTSLKKVLTNANIFKMHEWDLFVSFLKQQLVFPELIFSY